MTAKLGRDDAQIIHAYLRAYERRPTRAEPWVEPGCGPS